MSWLTEKSCQVCRADAPRVDEVEVKQFMGQIPDWEIVQENGANRLKRTFEMSDFVEALTFAWKVGEMAEAEGHHPVLVVEWGRLTVTWWTHKIDGLHENDFVMAAKTDQMSMLFPLRAAQG